MTCWLVRGNVTEDDPSATTVLVIKIFSSTFLHWLTGGLAQVRSRIISSSIINVYCLVLNVRQQRHVSDSQVNNRKSKTLRNGKLVEEKWSDVQVGDVIRMENNQFVAADLLLLSSSEPNGLCFIETAELDGETNLKCKQCLVETSDMGQRDDLLAAFDGEILCEPPNNLLNKFDGTLLWQGNRYSLDNDKILLRGCVLRNTQVICGYLIVLWLDGFK